jgi:hypothetical protein
MATYRTIRACRHGGHFFKIGDSFTPTPEQVREKAIPRHFVREVEFSPEAVEEAAKEEQSTRRTKIRAVRAGE